jgi:uncharacterized DUF497 family protein
MAWMFFRWLDSNEAAIAKHGISIEECEAVASKYEPTRRGENLLATGPTPSGRWIEVLYVMEDDMTAFVMHAMDVKPKKRKRRK